jgi:hypothetical protein
MPRDLPPAEAVRFKGGLQELRRHQGIAARRHRPRGGRARRRQSILDGFAATAGGHGQNRAVSSTPAAASKISAVDATSSLVS